MIRLALAVVLLPCAALAQSQSGGGVVFNSTTPFVATGSATARSSVDRFADTINIFDEGGVGDLVSFSDGTFTSGNVAFSSNLANMTSVDVGKPIDISGAGSNGHTLATTIATITGAHSGTLSAAPSTSSGNSYLASLVIVAAGSGFAPGDVVPLTSGTAAITANAAVVATKVVSATVVSGGSGGTGLFGFCGVTGTTGTGRFFRAQTTISGGAIAGVTSIYEAGEYTTNPTTITNEPVTGCGLTGAVLSVVMGVSTITANAPGSYSAVPSNPVSQGAAITGSGTGATFTAQWNLNGVYSYGTDNGPAIGTAVGLVNSLYAASGAHPCIFFPARDSRFPNGVGYFVRSAPTQFVMTVPGCVGGEAANHSIIQLSRTFSGQLFSWSNSWVHGQFPLSGRSPVSEGEISAIVSDLTIYGDNDAPSEQDALVFYDHEDHVYINDVTVKYLAGMCFGAGILKNNPTASFTESWITNFDCASSGTPTVPAILDTSNGSAGSDASNEVHWINTLVIRCMGKCMQITNPSGVSSVRLMRFFDLRAERSMDGDDLLQFGDNTTSGGPLGSIDIYGLDIEQGQLDHAGLRFSANASATAPSAFNIFGIIGTAAGYGVSVDAGSNIQLHLTTWGGTQAALQVGPSPFVADGIYIDAPRVVSSISYQIDTTSYAFLHRTLTALGPPFENQLSVGQGAAGFQTNSSSLGFNLTTNQVATFLMGIGVNDNAIEGHRVWGEHTLDGNAGNNAIGDLILLGVSTSTNPVTLTTNQATTASSINVAVPFSSGVFSGILSCMALNITNGDIALWEAPHSIIQKTGTAASTAILKSGTLASVYADAGASTWTFTMTADTSVSGGLVPVFTGSAGVHVHAACAFKSILEIR